MKTINTASAVFAVLVSLASTLSLAQDKWPSRPVKVIVPSAPGGGTDLYARLMAAGLSESLKQQFFVDNRPGGNGTIGADAVARSAPDGYTILISASPALVVNPLLYKNLPYDADRDFAPVSGGVITPLLFVANPSVPARTLGELVALGKKEPGKYTYGTSQFASATSLGVQLLEQNSGAKFTLVPYKGLGQAVQDLLSGQISFLFSDFPVVLAQVKSGKLIALAATHHTKALSNVPTTEEAGFPIGDVVASFMISAPAGVPQPIIHKLNAEINRLMKSPATAEKLEAHLFIPLFGSPEDFAARLKRQRAMWADAIVKLGIKPE